MTRCGSRQLQQLATDLPRPAAVLVVSAHWEAAPLMLGATESGAPGLRLLRVSAALLRGDLPGTRARPSLADRVASCMPDTTQVERTDRGLDHGAYVPLTVMYPGRGRAGAADVAADAGARRAAATWAGACAELRDEGVLIIGSGFTTHGLPFLTRQHCPTPPPRPPGWSREFDAWAHERLAAGDVEGLAAFRDRAPGMPYAHPTIEHFAPMFVTLGAADDPEQAPGQPIDGFWMGLAKRSFVVN